VFDDLPLIIETEDIHGGPGIITGPVLATMKDHLVALGDDVFEFDALAGVIASGFREIRDEPFLAVGDTPLCCNLNPRIKRQNKTYCLRRFSHSAANPRVLLNY